jgi:acyl carrier protein
MTNKDIYNKIFIELFMIEENQLNEKLVYQSIPAWDSVGHMNLIASLEEKFEIMMDTEDIIDFSSYEKGKTILNKYNVTI